MNLAIPRDRASGPMDLLFPTDVYWYNSGDYDHVSDMAIVMLPEAPANALDVSTVSFEDPRPGETVYAVGYPSVKSKVLYDLNEVPGEAGEFFREVGASSLFLWGQVQLRGYCSRLGAATELSIVDFEDPEILGVDGMSGAPVFSIRNNRPTCVGMVVRGAVRPARLHIISGFHLGTTIAFRFARDPEVNHPLVASIKEDPKLRHEALRKAAGLCLQVLGGDKPAVTEVLLEWQDGKRGLLDILWDRVESRGPAELAKAIGEEMASYLFHTVNWRRHLPAGNLKP